jgi:small subunit ribosomal protein S6
MSNITHYELTTIIDSNIPDNEHQEIIDKIKKLISDNKGEISSEENLGRKKLSYPIEKSLKGVFVCIEFNIEPNTIKPIEKELKLNKNIIRYLIIKKPENIVPASMEKPKKKEEKIVKEDENEEIKKEIKRGENNKKENPEDKKSDLTDLDKKLDEILNDEIIN